MDSGSVFPLMGLGRVLGQGAGVTSSTAMDGFSLSEGSAMVLLQRGRSGLLLGLLVRRDFNAI